MSQITFPYAKTGKIAIIGSGAIAQKVVLRLGTDGSAHHITLQNRPDEKETDLNNGIPTIKKKLAGEITAIDQAFRSEDDNPHCASFQFTMDMAVAMRGANIVIDLAGRTRILGEERSNMVRDNSGPVDDIATYKDLAHPDALYIVAANPAETLGYYLWEKSGLDANQILTLGGVLDSARLKQAISFQLNLEPQKIKYSVALGQHGENMFVPLSCIKIVQSNGSEIPLIDYIEQNVAPELQSTVKAEILDATIQGGKRQIKAQGTSDAIAPASAICRIVRSWNRAKYLGLTGDVLSCGTLVDRGNFFTNHPISFDSNGKRVLEPLQISSFTNVEREVLRRSDAACINDLNDLPNRRGQAMAA